MAEVFCRACGKPIDESALSCPHCGAQQVGVEISALTAFKQRQWSGFWRRFGAQFVDGLVLYIPITVLVSLSAMLFSKINPGANLLLIILEELVVYVIYQGWLNSSEKMATLGRRAVGIAMVDATTGAQIGYWRACARALLGFVSNLLIVPNLIQLFTPERRSVADYCCGTVIVQRKQGVGGVVVAAVGAVCVFAFIGVLAAIAIPAYQDYTVRARVTQALLTDATTAKRLVEGNALKGSQDLGSGRVPPISPSVESLSIATNGIISLRMNAAAKSVQLMMRPSTSQGPLAPGQAASGAITWTCKVDDVKNDRYVPSECRL